VTKTENIINDFASDLLALLDLIEAQKDWKLAVGRFVIAEKHGLKVKFLEQISGRMN